MTESIDKATATSDVMTWSIMFGLLIVVAVGLAIWNNIEENKNK